MKKNEKKILVWNRILSYCLQAKILCSLAKISNLPQFQLVFHISYLRIIKESEFVRKVVFLQGEEESGGEDEGDLWGDIMGS